MIISRNDAKQEIEDIKECQRQLKKISKKDKDEENRETYIQCMKFLSRHANMLKDYL